MEQISVSLPQTHREIIKLISLNSGLSEGAVIACLVFKQAPNPDHFNRVWDAIQAFNSEDRFLFKQIDIETYKHNRRSKPCQDQNQ